MALRATQSSTLRMHSPQSSNVMVFFSSDQVKKRYNLCMRTWNLAAGDPLHLTLSADARLGPTDYADDITWELGLGGGEPPALSLRTTFGLRARWMQFFPIFYRAGQTVHDPDAFHRAPRLTRFFANYLDVNCAPYEGIEVRAEYRAASSQVAAGRLTITNQSVLPHNLRLDLSAVLNPLGFGEGMAAVQMGLGMALQGRSDGIAVVCFVSGGPQPGKGPYPGLSQTFELYPGASVETLWAVAAAPLAEAAFEQAQAAANRTWEAELARIEVRNTADQMEITTGSPDWDAAFALGQRAALGLLLSNPEQLPAPSFVLTRRIDQGASARGDGSDYPYLWAGQTALDSWYMASLLPGLPGFAEGLVRNVIAAAGEGLLDFRPGLGGQRTRYLVQPLLASLASQVTSTDFLTAAFPPLLASFKAWLSPEHDCDGDGLPEWEHPIQTGLESSPLYDRWSATSQGVNIAWVESPALGALLYREALALAQMARRLNLADDRAWLEVEAARIRSALATTWDKRARIFRYRDTLTHASRAGKELGTFHGSGQFAITRKLTAPSRLIIHVEASSENTRAVIGTITGLGIDGQPVEEQFSPRDFTWSLARARATTRLIFSQVDSLEVNGLVPEDRARLIVPDFTRQDISLFLPLWASATTADQAKALVEKHLMERFLLPYGVPICPPDQCPAEPPELACVAMPWNALIGEGLLLAGFRLAAADLVTRLMQGVVINLKEGRGFRQYYHAATGQGFGERNHLWGLPPLGLFLRTAGLESIAPGELMVRGFNPFPWPITVKYQRMTITRDGERTTLALPGKQPIIATGQQLQRITLP